MPYSINPLCCWLWRERTPKYTEGQCGRKAWFEHTMGRKARKERTPKYNEGQCGRKAWFEPLAKGHMMWKERVQKATKWQCGRKAWFEPLAKGHTMGRKEARKERLDRIFWVDYQAINRLLCCNILHCRIVSIHACLFRYDRWPCRTTAEIPCSDREWFKCRRALLVVYDASLSSVFSCKHTHTHTQTPMQLSPCLFCFIFLISILSWQRCAFAMLHCIEYTTSYMYKGIIILSVVVLPIVVSSFEAFVCFFLRFTLTRRVCSI